MASNYPVATRFVGWALARTRDTMDSVEFEGRHYHLFTKVWRGNLKTKAAPIYSEIGEGRVYLKNEELHQVWIEKTAEYASDFGKLMVGETVYKVAACCRCGCELLDEATAKLAACEDCLDFADSDPEALLAEWAKSGWG